MLGAPITNSLLDLPVQSGGLSLDLEGLIPGGLKVVVVVVVVVVVPTFEIQIPHQ